MATDAEVFEAIEDSQQEAFDEIFLDEGKVYLTRYGQINLTKNLTVHLKKKSWANGAKVYILHNPETDDIFMTRDIRRVKELMDAGMEMAVQAKLEKQDRADRKKQKRKNADGRICPETIRPLYDDTEVLEVLA